MTDQPAHSSPHLTEAAARRLKARRRGDLRLRLYGLLAVALAALALAALLLSVIGRAMGAMSAYSFKIETTLPAEKLGAAPTERAKADYNGLVKQALYAQFPALISKREKKAVTELASSGAADDLRKAVLAGEVLPGEKIRIEILASGSADLYYKGFYGGLAPLPAAGEAKLIQEGGLWLLEGAPEALAHIRLAAEQALKQEAASLRSQAEAQQRGVLALEGKPEEARPYAEKRDALLAQAAELERRAGAAETEKLGDKIPSFLVRFADAAGGGWGRVAAVAPQALVLEPLTPLSARSHGAGTWRILQTERPAIGRKVNDLHIALLEDLRAQGAVERKINWRFFTSGDSREAELAGVKGAMAGTFWTLLISLAFAFPMGVAAAIYLEEFAPKNRITDFLEVNINNLAAVPSIVYGLLGLGVFLHFMGLPRGAPIAGGLVLGLMTLPTVIIAARAALRAVPPSIRDGALGLGASKTQAVFHHVLPLATPGLMTGAILALARAMGETAPLLLIGMVAFIVDTPRGPMDPATTLSVQIFRWSDLPERAFEFRTAAAILTLLAFLICLNALAAMIRRRFERRW